MVHPMITEGCVDFAARTMKEIFPAKGPVKSHIIGKSSREKIEKADRKRTYMNWQCTKQIRELRPSVETLLTQLPLGGSQYLKIWPDARFARPRAEFIPIDKFVIPSAAADLWSATRKTHIQDITRDEFESRIANGLYDEAVVDGTDSPTPPDKTEAEKANDKIEGKSDTSYNEDGLRQLYESYVLIEVEGDAVAPEGRVAPYIVTVDESTGTMLAMYRNWSERKKADDEIARLTALIDAARTGLASALSLCEASKNKNAADAVRQDEAAAALDAEAAAVVAPDVSAIVDQIGNAESTNAKVRANAAHVAAKARAKALADEYAAKTAAIDAIDAERTKRIADAKMPIDGLSFSEDGAVTFRGVPMSQASQAEAIRVSMAIGLAMSPELKIVLIRDGSLLDADSRTLVADIAAANGAQVWMEIVGKEAGAVEIEDGALVGGAA